ncbi:hypothetical protein SRHO_G00143810 [Serrasalmus rhombeus]
MKNARVTDVNVDALFSAASEEEREDSHSPAATAATEKPRNNEITRGRGEARRWLDVVPLFLPRSFRLVGCFPLRTGLQNLH